MSNSSKHIVIRLPHAADKAASSIADEAQRRKRVAAVLRALVERDVVPRLLADKQVRPIGRSAFDSPVMQTVPPHPLPGNLSAETINDFADLLLRDASADIETFVQRLRADGLSPDALCLHLLTAAARHLGDLWVADRASFSDVTLATDHLQRLFSRLAPELPSPGPAEPLPAAGVALLTTVPGEQHSFGLSMLAAFFRRAGWNVSTPAIRNVAALQRRVAAGAIDLLGISLGAEMHLAELTRCIERVRRSARTDLIVMVGGPLFIERPGLAREVGADATASDAVGAISIAEQLLRARHARAASTSPLS